MQPNATLPKQIRRELPRWRAILAARSAGVSIAQLASDYDVTDTQVYALLAKAKHAKEQGWLC